MRSSVLSGLLREAADGTPEDLPLAERERIFSERFERLVAERRLIAVPDAEHRRRAAGANE